jgi:Domain of unknown function (DUF6429)
LGITWINEAVMDIDTEKVDEAVLAVLYLTLHDHVRAWKGIDWEVMARLHQKGLIEGPVGKQKSVVFTDEGLRKAANCFDKLLAGS